MKYKTKYDIGRLKILGEELLTFKKLFSLKNQFILLYLFINDFYIKNNNDSAVIYRVFHKYELSEHFNYDYNNDRRLLTVEFRKYVTINRSELMINYYVVDPLDSFKKINTGRIKFINIGR